MDYKERLKQYLEEDVIYSEYKSGKCDMSDFDKFCIEHCKDIECLLNEVQELKEVIDKAIEYINGTYEMAVYTKSISLDEENIEDLLDILKEVE